MQNFEQLKIFYVVIFFWRETFFLKKKKKKKKKKKNSKQLRNSFGFIFLLSYKFVKHKLTFLENHSYNKYVETFLIYRQ